MGNPFFIPAGPSVGERVAQPLTELMRIRQAGELGQEHNRLAAEDIALRTQALEQGKATLVETQRANRAKEPLSRQNFGPEEKKAFLDEIKNIDPENAFKWLDKATSSFVLNPKADKGHVYGHLLNNWDTFYKKQAIKSVKEVLANPEVDPGTKEYYDELLKGLESPNSVKILDRLMPNVAMEWQAAQAEIQARAGQSQGVKVVNPGGAVYDPISGKVVYQAPQEQKQFAPHYPTPTTEGYVTIGPDGQPQPVISPTSGKPLMPPVADPNLAGAKKAAQEEAERVSNLKKTMPKSRETLSSLERQWDIVEKTIDKALTQVSPFSAGIGAWSRIIPTSPAKDLNENLKTIQANIGFDKLQQMRSDSPTGGALGQVSDFENKLLQAVQGSLDQSQSVPQLIENLNSVKGALQGLRAQKRFAFDYDFREVRPQGEQSKVQPLPEGLSEDDMNFNMQKYGKSRQEVIDQFNKRKGVK